MQFELYFLLEEFMGEFRVAQICMNGHTITSAANVSPERMAKACSICGEKTISNCPECDSAIRGIYHERGVVMFQNYHAPSYCHECGNPYPWTVRQLDAARQLIMEDDKTSQEEQQELIEVLPALLVELPQSKLAAIRFKRFLGKASVFIGEGLKEIIISLASDAMKRSLGL